MLDDVYERHDTIDITILWQRSLLLDRKEGGGTFFFALLYGRTGLVWVMALEKSDGWMIPPGWTDKDALLDQTAFVF